VIIAVGADHAGQETKQALIADLERLGHQVHDLTAADQADGIDYPDSATAVAREVARADAERGILVCGTGIGMSITANKIAGVRAALCTDPEMAKLSREHNDANVLCLGGRILSEAQAIDILHAWLGVAASTEPRHLRRRAKIADLERGPNH
jgi:RpiB/LacA/LacB family sugar-phosphate isomerase